MSKIIVIGIDQQMADTRATLFRHCHCAFSTNRLTSILNNFLGPVHSISPLSDALEKMSQELANGDVAVLASGDPLFFGIGRTLIKRFGQERVEIHPALSTLQLACAHFNEPWDDAQFLSLHGRDKQFFAAQIIQAPKTVIFTDHIHTPAVISQIILANLQKIDASPDMIQIMIAENLGTTQERFTSGNPTKIAQEQFSDLNIMIIKNHIKVAPPLYRLGLEENDLKHSRGLITKSEVRAATLHCLRLPSSGVFWDLGAGSGSISVEAARLFPRLMVFAVEKKPEEQDNIRQNIKRFKLANLSLIQGQAPEATADLPNPQRIFIGGSGGRLAEIIANTVPRLSRPGILTLNAVTATTREAAPPLLHAQGLSVTMSTIQVSRCTYPSENSKVVDFKPITIITGTK